MRRIVTVFATMLLLACAPSLGPVDLATSASDVSSSHDEPGGSEGDLRDQDASSSMDIAALDDREAASQDRDDETDLPDADATERLEDGSDELTDVQNGPDLWPGFSGTYELEGRLDLLSLEGPSERLRRLQVESLALDPSGSLLLLLAELAKDSGSAAWLRDNLFQYPDKPDIAALTMEGEAFRHWINVVGGNLVAQACEATLGGPCYHLCPEDLGISQAFSQAKLLSRLECTTEPTENGFLPSGSCIHRWDAVATAWSSASTSCKAQASLVAAPSPVEVNLSRTQDVFTLSLGSHAGPDPAAAHRLLLERVVMPKVFGDDFDLIPPAECYEQVIASLLAGRQCLRTSTCCEDFATGFGAQVPGLNQMLLEGACDVLIVIGAEVLRHASEDLGAPIAMTLDASSGPACALVGSPVTTIGSAAAPCHWQVRTESMGAVATTDAPFTGHRASAKP